MLTNLINSSIRVIVLQAPVDLNYNTPIIVIPLQKYPIEEPFLWAIPPVPPLLLLTNNHLFLHGVKLAGDISSSTLASLSIPHGIASHTIHPNTSHNHNPGQSPTYYMTSQTRIVLAISWNSFHTELNNVTNPDLGFHQSSLIPPIIW